MILLPLINPITLDTENGSGMLKQDETKSATISRKKWWHLDDDHNSSLLESAIKMS
ncbi:hypothetical protein HQQ94_13190 [Shewanella sp. VB17]|uniref:hypothetical protein n=1 Tax=Shewanella sp. VB17 TaxID=2739432 RepID=UPI0015655494|nr:hypothetical protein [Shewanella sp. VB17]NRD74174.1 hypothetical protein [Shewanella sp. VB17]